MLKNIIAFLLLITIAGSVNAAIDIFACEPEWGALAEEIGGDRVNIYVATTAKQDPHLIEARPSLLAKSRKAELLFCTGADLELGWLPILLKKTGNPKIQPGKPGHLFAANYVKLEEVYEKVSRSMGDVHAKGNPHIHLDPRNMLPIAHELQNRLISIDPDNHDYYQQRLGSFDKRWRGALARWKEDSIELQGMPIVVHHRSWVYLEKWLGLKEVAALEPKPGIPPTSAHLAQLISLLDAQPARAVIRSPYQDPRSSKWLEEKIDIAAIMLPFTVGGTPEANDLFSLFDDTISRLKQISQ